MSAGHRTGAELGGRWAAGVGVLADADIGDAVSAGCIPPEIEDAWTRAFGVPDVDGGHERLFTEQRAAASALAERLRRDRCALAADPVGSGKTYVAIGAALTLLDEGKEDGSEFRDALVVCPRPIVEQWEEVLEEFGLAWGVVSDGLLSRGGSEASRRGLNAPGVGLVIVDEAHRFRNPNTRRYASLVRIVGYRAVLFLSATPVWNSRRDLLALLRIGVGELAFRRATGRSVGELWSSIDDDDEAYRSLLERFVLRRDEMTSSRGRHVRALAPRSVSRGVIDAVRAGARAAMLVEGEPSELFARLVMRRLASSPEAARATLRRGREFLQSLEDAGRVGRSVTREEFRRVLGPLGGQTVFSFWFSDDALRVRRPVGEAMALVDAALVSLRGQATAGSARARAAEEFIGRHAKTVVFSEFADSARALFEALPHSWSPLLVCGAGGEVAGIGRMESSQAWRLFREGHPRLRFCSRVAITTPVGSEGLNLQMADAVLHYDLPWNPARMEQRVGRVDRQGGDGRVSVLVLEPDADLEAEFGGLGILKTKARVRSLRSGSPRAYARTSDGGVRDAVAAYWVLGVGPDGAGRALVVLAGVGRSFGWRLGARGWRPASVSSLLERCDWSEVVERDAAPPWCDALVAEPTVSRRAASAVVDEVLERGASLEAGGCGAAAAELLEDWLRVCGYFGEAGLWAWSAGWRVDGLSGRSPALSHRGLERLAGASGAGPSGGDELPPVRVVEVRFT